MLALSRHDAPARGICTWAPALPLPYQRTFAIRYGQQWRRAVLSTSVYVGRLQYRSTFSQEHGDGPQEP